MAKLYKGTLSAGPLGITRLGDTGADQGGYRRWVQPELVIRTHDAVTDPGLGELGLRGASAGGRLPLDELAQNYISSRRDACVTRGWQQFKDGQYREACDTFLMADAVSVDSSVARSEVKLAIVHAAVASRQYGLAVGSLKWLLDENPKTGLLRDPKFLSRLPALPEMYGHQPDYEKHMGELEALLKQTQAASEVAALRAVMLWANGSTRSRALGYARDLSGPQGEKPWASLYEVMLQSQGEQGSSAVGGPAILGPVQIDSARSSEPQAR